MHTEHTDSTTGTSINTPDDSARAARDSGPNSAIAVATASSKKLLGPGQQPRQQCTPKKSWSGALKAKSALTSCLLLAVVSQHCGPRATEELNLGGVHLLSAPS